MSRKTGIGALAARACVAVLCASAIGCSTAVTVPDNVFSCTASTDCPDGFSCVEMRCRAPRDAGTPSVDGSAPAPDAATDAAIVPTDASAGGG